MNTALVDTPTLENKNILSSVCFFFFFLVVFFCFLFLFHFAACQESRRCLLGTFSPDSLKQTNKKDRYTIVIEN